MPRSVAVVIMNGMGLPCKIGTKLQNIVNHLYMMDANVSVLVNKTSREIKQCINEILKMKKDDLADIICVIEAPKAGENEFITKNGIINVLDDILMPIFCQEAWKTKIKLFITNGIGSSVPLQPSDGPAYLPVSHGQNVAFITSIDYPDFVETFVTNLVKEHGDFRKVVDQIGHERFTVATSAGTKYKIQINTPPVGEAGA